MSKVVIGMSGGVDSSAAAAILKEEGYEVIGVTLKLCSNNNTLMVNDAKKVCEKLGIKHYELDFQDEFQKRVIDKFISEYFNGRTPNPCIECNKYLKFNYLLEKALEMGCEYIATGHYANVEYNAKIDRYLLSKSQSDLKDQTYVLYNLTQEQLKRVLFPLGKYSNKDEIRELANKYDLDIAQKPDSQDICFIPDGDYKSFLQKYDKDNKIKPGNIIDINGKVLGKHNGTINYTIGQRKGLGLAMPNPVFVTKIDIVSNLVTVSDEKDLYTNELIADSLNWIMFDKLEEKMKVKAKTRYSSRLEDATIEMINNNEVEVVFDNPQRAITAGQAVVFYKDEYIIGGGTIK